MTAVWILVIGLNANLAVVPLPYPSMEACLQVGNNWATHHSLSPSDISESQNRVPSGPGIWATCLPGFR